MELNGISNAILTLRLAEQSADSLTRVRIREALKELELFCAYVRELEERPGMFWHEFKIIQAAREIEEDIKRREQEAK